MLDNTCPECFEMNLYTESHDAEPLGNPPKWGETMRNQGVEPWEKGWNRKNSSACLSATLFWLPQFLGGFALRRPSSKSWSFCHGSYVRFLAKNCLVPKQSAGGAQLGDKSLALGAQLESARCLDQGSRLKTHQESWSATCQLYITVPGRWFGRFFIFHDMG